jgi:serine/threonine protein kinase
MIAGIEIDYDVNLDQLMGAGGQGDVYQAERKIDKLQVAIKVIPRSKLRPGPGVCIHLTTIKEK